MSNNNPIDASSNCQVFTWYTTGPNPNTIPPYQYPIPNPPRLWSRFKPKCPGPNVNFEILDMRRKAEILQYKNNNSNSSKNQRFSLVAKNALTRKKGWASQTQEISIPNDSGLNQSGDSILCPSPLIQCALTSDSNVPGPIIPLCYDPNVPLYNYKNDNTYSGGNSGVPDNAGITYPEFIAPVVTPTTITLNWVPPLNNAGYPITGYKIIMNPPISYGSNIIINDGKIHSKLIEGVTILTTYQFSITSISDYAEYYSDYINVTPYNYPNSPTNIIASGVGSLKIKVSWNPSLLTRESPLPIKYYTIYTYLINGVTPVRVNKVSIDNIINNSYVINNLIDNNTYYFKVSATSDIGEGEQSLSSNTFIACDVPNTPTNFIGNYVIDSSNVNVNLSWTPPSNTSIVNYKITYTTTDSVVGLTNIILQNSNNNTIIYNLLKNKTYIFSLFAYNQEGISEPISINIIMPRLPSKVIDLEAFPGNTFVTLEWRPPITIDNSVITSYIVTYDPSGIDGKSSSTNVNINGETNIVSAVILNLENNTSYNFNVCAVNILGNGDISNINNIIPYYYADPPTNIIETNATNNQITLSWTAPINNGGRPVINYSIKYYLANQTKLIPSIINTQDNDTTYTLDNLIPETYYNISIASINIEGVGSYSSPPNLFSPLNKPLPPLHFTGVGGNKFINLSWDNSSNYYNFVTSYKIIYDPSGGIPNTPINVLKNINSIKIDNLINGTIYKFSITSLNNKGESEPSLISNIIPFTNPDAPILIQPTIENNGIKNKKILLTWYPPNNGGYDIISYIINYGASGESIITNTETIIPQLDNSVEIIPQSGLISGLTNGVMYNFQITAVSRNTITNENLYSQKSLIISAKPNGLPDPPVLNQPLFSDGTIGNGQITLIWSIPDNGGSPIISYNIYEKYTLNNINYSNILNVDASNNNLIKTNEYVIINGITKTIPQYKYIINNLSNGTTYNFKVAAVTNVGIGELSNEINATPYGPSNSPVFIIPTLPSPLGNGYIGDKQLTISWNTPNIDKKLFAQYVLEYTPSTGYDICGNLITSPIIITDINTTIRTFYKLTNGNSYNFRLVSIDINNNISNPPSLLTAIPVGFPTEPSIIQPTFQNGGLGDSKINLSWRPPLFNGGSPITSYTINYSPPGTDYVSSITLDVSAIVLQYYYKTISNLENGITYSISIRCNNIFYSSMYNSIYASPITIPYSPTFTPAPNTPYVKNNNIYLSWVPPVNDGGSPILYYKIYYNVIDASGLILYLVNPQGNLTSYVITDIKKGVNTNPLYKFQISAVNIVGESPLSFECLLPIYDLLKNPTIINATQESNKITLYWIPPTITIYDPINYYNIYYCPVGENLQLYPVQPNGNARSQDINGIINGIPYMFQMTAYNSAGEGLLSNTYTTMSYGLPGPPIFINAIINDSQITLYWNSPLYDGGYPITNYIIKYGLSSNNITTYSIINNISSILNVTSQTIYNITNNIEYTYYIYSVNKSGISNEYAIYKGTTLGKLPPVTNFVATIDVSNNINLSWNAPVNNDGSITPLSAYVYKLSYDVLNGNGITSYYSTPNPLSSSNTNYRITNTFYGSKYLFKIQVISTLDNNNNSIIVTIKSKTLPGPPYKITNVYGNNINNTIKLFWNIPFDGGSPIRYYNIKCYPGMLPKTYIPINNQVLSNINVSIPFIGYNITFIPNSIYAIVTYPYNSAGNANNTISIFNCVTNTNIQTITLKQNSSPICCVVNSKGTKAYISSLQSPSYLAYIIINITISSNTLNFSVENYIYFNSLNCYFQSLAITKDDKFLYGVIPSGNSVSIINLSNNTVVATLSGTMFYPNSVIISPDQKYAYVLNLNSIAIINILNNTIQGYITNRINMNMSWTITNNLVISNDSRYLYISNPGSPGSNITNGSVLEYDLSNNIYTNSYSTPNYAANYFTLSPDGNYLYISYSYLNSLGSSYIKVININRNSSEYNSSSIINIPNNQNINCMSIDPLYNTLYISATTYVNDRIINNNILSVPFYNYTTSTTTKIISPSTPLINMATINVFNGITYEFKVNAVNDLGSGVDSSGISILIPNNVIVLPAPTNIKINTSINYWSMGIAVFKNITFSWDPVPGAIFYILTFSASVINYPDPTQVSINKTITTNTNNYSENLVPLSPYYGGGIYILRNRQYYGVNISSIVAYSVTNTPGISSIPISNQFYGASAYS